jgi:hypothetical protein
MSHIDNPRPSLALPLEVVNLHIPPGLLLDSRVVSSQVWYNRLFLQACPEERD